MIYYFSGTGNSRHAALRIAELLGMKAEAIPVATPSDDAVTGIVFPVYGWRPPQIVRDFIARLKDRATGYTFVVMTCGDDAGEAMDFVDRAGLRYHSAFTVIMPNTYVCLPLFDVGKPEVVNRKLTAAEPRLQDIAEAVKDRRSVKDIHEGRWPRLKTYVLGAYFERHLITDRPFHVSQACNSCRSCERACRVSNISMSAAGRPVWGGHCTGCMACYHICHAHAIRYGKHTNGKGQYRYRDLKKS